MRFLIRTPFFIYFGIIMTVSTPSASTIDSLSFDQALTELEKIVRDMESGKTGLEESISAYERGVRLKNHAAQRLKDAQMRIDQITQNADGTLGLTPFDQPKE
jgi:exodeoxyribonuclease VII small subunit